MAGDALARGDSMQDSQTRTSRRAMLGAALGVLIGSPALAREPRRSGAAQTFHGGQQDGTGIRRRAPGTGAAQNFLGGQQEGTGIRRRAPGSALPGPGAQQPRPRGFMSGGGGDGTGI